MLPSWGRHRDKVSVVAALSIAPTLRRLGLYWLADPEHYVTAETVVTFLRKSLRHLRGCVIVVCRLFWGEQAGVVRPAVRQPLLLLSGVRLAALQADQPSRWR